MNNPNVKKTTDALGGVKCVVDSCYYNTQTGGCTASSIEVAPKNASSYEETDCVTFMKKGQQ